METLYPGLYRQEIKGQPPTEGVSTSVAGFAGIAERGPIGKPGYVTSFDEYLTTYGGFLVNSMLTYAVRGYFENGGSRAYISRVAHYSNGILVAKKASVNIGAADSYYLIVDALYEGAYGNAISVKLENYNNTKKTFDLRVLESGIEKEVFKGVSLLTIEALVNGKSALVSVSVLDDELTVSNGTATLSGGVDGVTSVDVTDYELALKAFDNVDVKLLSLPGITGDDYKVKAIAYAHVKHAFLVTVPNYALKPADYVAGYDASPAIDERHGNYFGGWGYVADPIGVGKNPEKVCSLEGHIIGTIVRIDNERGIAKAPAGTEAKLRGVTSLVYSINDAEHGLLNPRGINAVRTKPGSGIVIWGARTTDVEGDFKYVTDRRVADFVEDSIMEGADWSVFEPNDDALYEKLISTGSEFLRGFWLSGGLAGQTEEEAFFIKVAPTQAQVDAGQVPVSIGIARRKPSEFIIFSFTMIR